MTEEFLCHEGGADLVGVYAVPRDKGGVADAAIVLVHLLEIHEDASVLFRNAAADGDVFVHACPHFVLAVWLNVIGREDENSLDGAFCLALLDHRREIALIFLGEYRLIGEGGGVELTPHVIDADTDGYPIGIKVNAVAVKALQ